MPNPHEVEIKRQLSDKRIVSEGQDLDGLDSSLLVLLGPTWVIPWYQAIEYGVPTLQNGKKQIACRIIKVQDQWGGGKSSKPKTILTLVKPYYFFCYPVQTLSLTVFILV